MTQEIKPSDLKEFKYLVGIFEIQHIHPSARFYTPDNYLWYKIGEYYYPHRKPTANEIINDKFV